MRAAWAAAAVATLVALAAARYVLRARAGDTWAERAAAAVAREHPHWHVAHPAKDLLELTYRGARAEIRLDDMRRGAEGDEARFEREVLKAAEAARHVIDRSAAQGETPLDFETVRARLYPVLVPREYAAAQKFVFLPFAGDVVEAFVFDGEHHQQYVHDSTFGAPGVAPSALHDAAVTALSLRIRGETWPALRPEDPAATGAYVIVDVTDGYAAARLLLPEARERLSKALGYPFFAAVPNRDFLVAWSRDYTFAKDFAAKVRQDFERRSHPVSPEVYRVDASGVSRSGG